MFYNLLHFDNINLYLSIINFLFIIKMKQRLLFSYTLLLATIGLQAQTKIGSDILGLTAYEQSGGDVSISGDGTVVAIGARLSSANGFFAGQGRIFKNVSGTWTQIGQDINGGIDEMLGAAVSISYNGNIVAFGGPFHDSGFPDTGYVKVFENRSGIWSQIGANIDGKAQQESAGYSISLTKNGDIIAVGAPYSNLYGTQSGTVRVYQNVNDVWTQIGSDIGNADSDVVNEPYDQLGFSVSISSDGSIVAVGAPYKLETTPTHPGKVAVYQNIDGVWTQVGNTIKGKFAGDKFGTSVSLSGDGTVLAVGSPNYYGEFGAVRIYRNVAGTWTQIGNEIFGESGGSHTGLSVSLSSDGTIVAVGAPDNGGGQTRIYKNVSDNWEKIATINPNDINSGFFGTSVSLSSNGATVAIGDPLNSQQGSLAGKTSVYDLSGILASDTFVLERTSVYPNPVKNELFIDLNENMNLQEVNIYTTLGQLIQTEKTNQINTSSLAKGFYLVQVVTDKGTATHKVLVD